MCVFGITGQFLVQVVVFLSLAGIKQTSSHSLPALYPPYDEMANLFFFMAL